MKVPRDCEVLEPAPQVSDLCGCWCPLRPKPYLDPITPSFSGLPIMISWYKSFKKVGYLGPMETLIYGP